MRIKGTQMLQFGWLSDAKVRDERVRLVDQKLSRSFFYDVMMTGFTVCNDVHAALGSGAL